MSQIVENEINDSDVNESINGNRRFKKKIKIIAILI